MEKIKITIIYDNHKEAPSLQAGWGFSALVEAHGRKILFDTGNDQIAFFSNIEKMNIYLEEVTEVMFSHAHKDHITGCREILGRLQKSCVVYLPKGFSSRKIPDNVHLQKIHDFQEINQGIFSLVLKAGLFLYEQILIVQSEQGLVVITGCAHPGIVNILEQAQYRLHKPIYFVLGGFHLFRKRRAFNEEIVKQFQSLNVKRVAPCHCSGDHVIEQFRRTYQDHFYQVGAGSIIELP